MFKVFERNIVSAANEVTALLTDIRSYRIVDRYHEAGEIEIVLPHDDQLYSRLKLGQYIRQDDDDKGRVWIISNIYREKVLNGVSKIVITGEGYVSITKRRTARSGWVQMYLAGATYENTVYPGLRPALIMYYLARYEFYSNYATNVYSEYRSAPHFWVNYTSEAVTIRNDEFMRNFDDNNIYQTLVYMSHDYGIGMRSSINENGSFGIEFYAGKNRTVLNDNGSSKPAGASDVVVFSELNENIQGIYEDKHNNGYRNSIFIATDPDASGSRSMYQYTIVNPNTDPYYGWVGSEGYELEEEYLKDVSISRYDTNGNLISNYDAAMLEYAKEWFITHQRTTSTEIEVDGADMDYVYGPNGDFYLGDTVSMSDDKGMYYTVRVTEALEYYDANGMTRTLTFTRVATYNRANINVVRVYGGGPK